MAADSLRIAVFSDVHGNLPALEAVLADIRREAPDVTVFAGDAVNGVPFLQACAQRIRALGIPAIRGNHEEGLAKYLAEPGHPRYQTESFPIQIRVGAELLAPAEREWLAGLPDRHVVEEVLVVHGTPRSHGENMPARGDLAEPLAGVEQRVVVCGHTHHSFVRQWQDRLVVNNGSVGLPLWSDHQAEYSLLTRRGGQWTAEIRRVPYPWQDALRALEGSEYSARLGPMARLQLLELKTGRAWMMPFFVFWAHKGGPFAEAIRLFLGE